MGQPIHADGRRVNLFLGVGQSNETGNGGQWAYGPNATYGANSPVTTLPRFFGLCSQPGVIPGVRDNAPPSTNATLLPFTPVQEGRDSFDASTGENVQHGESAATAFMNFLAQRTRERSAYGITARDGAGYQTGSGSQQAGGNPNNWSLRWVRAAVEQFGPAAVARAVLCTHGEQDAVNGAASTTVTADTALPAATINTAAFTVDSNILLNGFSGGSGQLVARTTAGLQYLTYTGATSGQFTGVSGGAGTIQAGDTIYRADYYFYLNTWLNDYRTNLLPITGQSSTLFPVNFYFWQQCAYPTGSGSNTGRTSLMGYRAFRDRADGGLKLVGPEYPFPYSTVGGSLHMNAGGQMWKGEMGAKFVWHNEFLGEDYRCLYPTSISRSGANIDVTFGTARGPLVLDCRTVKYMPNFGFSYTDSASTAISSVSVTGANTVRVVLAADPSANTRRYLRYAWDADSTGGGTMGGTRGNLRDSDGETGPGGYPLWNWCVIFEEAVP